MGFENENVLVQFDKILLKRCFHILFYEELKFIKVYKYNQT